MGANLPNQFNSLHLFVLVKGLWTALLFSKKTTLRVFVFSLFLESLEGTYLPTSHAPSPGLCSYSVLYLWRLIRYCLGYVFENTGELPAGWVLTVSCHSTLHALCKIVFLFLLLILERQREEGEGEKEEKQEWREGKKEWRREINARKRMCLEINQQPTEADMLAKPGSSLVPRSAGKAIWKIVTCSLYKIDTSPWHSDMCIRTLAIPLLFPGRCVFINSFITIVFWAYSPPPQLFPDPPPSLLTNFVSFYLFIF